MRLNAGARLRAFERVFRGDFRQRIEGDPRESNGRDRERERERGREREREREGS